MSHDTHESPEEIRKHVRTYLTIFAALGVLTAVTVGVAYLDVPIAVAIVIAMIVALTKGTLVAGFFMHLFGEKKIIFWVLFLTVIFFVFVMILPIVTDHDRVGQWTHPAALANQGGHGHEEHGEKGAAPAAAEKEAAH